MLYQNRQVVFIQTFAIIGPGFSSSANTPSRRRLCDPRRKSTGGSRQTRLLLWRYRAIAGRAFRVLAEAEKGGWRFGLIARIVRPIVPKIGEQNPERAGRNVHDAPLLSARPNARSCQSASIRGWWSVWSNKRSFRRTDSTSSSSPDRIPLEGVVRVVSPMASIKRDLRARRQ
jgi:hypothetical protein